MSQLDFSEIKEVKELKEEIATLKNVLADDLKDCKSEIIHDLFFVRLINARQHNLEAAATAARELLAFRKEHKCEEKRARIKAEGMRQQDFPLHATFFPTWPHRIFHGEDKEGRPITWDYAGLSDAAALTSSLTAEQVVEYYVWTLEWRLLHMDALSVERGRWVRLCKIIDLQHLNTSHLGVISYYRSLMKMSQLGYPGLMARVFVINAPWIFPTVYGLLKGYLNEALQQKVHIVPGNPKEYLLRYIAADQLSVYLGGTCECKHDPNWPDGCCPVRDAKANMTEATVPARDRLVVSVPVASQGLMVSWRAYIQIKDVNVAVLYRPADSKLPVAPQQQSTQISEQKDASGGFVAPAPGRLEFTFDNTYSYFTSKTVYYSVATADAPAASEDSGEKIS